MSLKTRDPKAALRLSRSASQSAERLIEAGAKQGMRYDDIRALLRKHFQGCSINVWSRLLHLVG